MTPQQARALFPALRARVWLNAAASSPLSTPVLEAASGFLHDSLEHGDVHYPVWAQLKEEVRAALARFIGATAAEIALTPSTGFGFHVIGHYLKARGITEVLTLECEFPSTTLPLLHDGLRLRGVRLRPDGTVTVADLEAALTPRTGAIAVSAVQYASGFRIDLEGVSALCRAKGLTFIVNAAQGIGHVPLDVERLGVDFLAATSHKWLAAGYGTGMLFVARRWLEEFPLPFGGWLSVEPHEQFDPWVHAQRVDDAHGFTARGTQFRRQASSLEGGGANWLNAYALKAALAMHEALGVAHTLRHNIALQLQLRTALRSLGFRPNTPDTVATLSGICVIPVKGAPMDVVRRLLHEARVATTARGSGVRISTHVFNDATDVEAVVEALRRLNIEPG
jgi:cysteine desulfurase / selenocysteine lyase